MPALLPEVVALDQRCLGGLWTLDGYRREIDSPNSDLLILQSSTSISSQEAISSIDTPQSSSLNDFSPISSTSSTRPGCLQTVGIGCLWAILEEAHITVLAIDPAYQGQGLGQVTLYALLVCAHQRGLEWATLEVRASNQRAISLYQKFDFQEVGRRRKYYQDNQEDALILWRKGLQQPEFSAALQNWRSQIEQRLARSNWQWPKSKNVNLSIEV